MLVILGPLFALTDIILGIFVWVMIATVVMSWLISFNIVNTSNRAVYLITDILYRLTEPLLVPIRRFLPNLQSHRFWVESEKRWVRLRVSRKGMRIIDKLGIESVLKKIRARGEKI